MINDFRLKVFIAAAQQGNFTRAARLLMISQPAVTKHIHELEKQTGSPLFERRGNSVSLTREGELLLGYALRIDSLYRELAGRLFTGERQLHGELKIGASTTVAQYILPPVLPLFRKNYPEIELNLVSGNTEEIEKLLTDKKIDLGLIEGNATSRQIHYEPLCEDRIVLATRTANKKFPRREIRPEDIASLPLVVREYGSGTLEVIEKALAEKGIRRKDLHIEMQLGSTEGIKKYIIHSDAFAFLSVHTIETELERGELRIVPVEKLSITRHFNFVSLHGSTSQLGGLFKQFCLLNHN